MQITENFFLHEFLRSQTAARHGIDMTPPQYVIDNIKDLCVSVLQPLRSDLGVPITVTSGYRPPVLNELIGGSRTSAHRHGRAADFVVHGHSPLSVCRRIVSLDLTFDQVIHEFGQWVHVGIDDDPRYERLTAMRKDGLVRYIRGLEEV